MRKRAEAGDNGRESSRGDLALFLESVGRSAFPSIAASRRFDDRRHVTARQPDRTWSATPPTPIMRGYTDATPISVYYEL